MVFTNDSPCLLVSKMVIELYKITRNSTCFESINLRRLFVDSNLIQEKYHRKLRNLIGMILLESIIIRTTWFDMKFKYKQTMISCEKALWFLFVQIKLLITRRLKAVSLIAEAKCGTVVT